MADWGTVPGWLEAVGTTGAFAVALALLTRELNAAREQRRGKKQRAAAGVTAWWEYDESKKGQPAPTFGQPYSAYYGAFWVLHVRNTGAEPVYDCALFLGPAPNPDYPPAEYFFPVLPPQTTLDDAIDDDEVAVWVEEKDSNEEPRRMSRNVWVEIFFRDAAGHQWKRQADGRLMEVSDLPTSGEVPYTGSRRPQ